jgi:hypothetical protein
MIGELEGDNMKIVDLNQVKLLEKKDQIVSFKHVIDSLNDVGFCYMEQRF